MTEYVETKILMAALNEDEEEGLRLIATMTRRERVELRRALSEVDDWIDAVNLFGDDSDAKGEQ